MLEKAATGGAFHVLPRSVRAAGKTGTIFLTRGRLYKRGVDTVCNQHLAGNAPYNTLFKA